MAIDRYIIVGAGAVGGLVAAALSFKAHDVVAIARGAHLDKMRADGLVVKSPEETRTARFECAASPAEIEFRANDAILLCTKTQDTVPVLDALRDAGVTDQPIFCLQNGVENERQALRRFANVHGVLIMMPVDYIRPGEVASFGAPYHGIFDIGRFPTGNDEDDRILAEALTDANIACYVQDAVVQGKYGKLLLNLRNAVEATVGLGPPAERLRALVMEEGEAVLTGAGIEWRDVGSSDPRRGDKMSIKPIDGVTRTGSSSTQSLARNAGSIETDFLNGEIVMLGRLHGVPAPANAYLTTLAARMVREGLAPGSIDIAEVERAIGL